MMRVEGELHVMLSKHVGHIDSPDCWCEPHRIFLAVVTGLPGITKVIEHNDESNEHHLLIINRRERDKFVPSPDYRANDGWITRALSPPWSPPLLPPHDPNKRSL